MEFLSYISELFSYREVGSGAAVRRSGSPGFASTYADIMASSNPALCVATVYRCVKLLSESVAQLPVRYERQKDGIFVLDETSGLNYLLGVQPNPAQNAFDFWAQVVTNVLMGGNAYIVPVYNLSASTPKALVVEKLVLCDMNAVSHDVYNDEYTINDTVNHVSGTYPEHAVIHIKGMSSFNPKTGVSVLTHARTAIETASIGDNETQSRFRTGGNVRGIVGNDRSVRGFGEYQDKELSKTAVNLDERFNVNGEHIVALPGMAGFTPISMTSADMQFLETRKFTVREICRFFGVHPSFVFDDTSNNYKSAEMANVAFLSNTLNPLLKKIELELLRKLVAPSLAAKRRFVFDRRDLMACDLDSRVRYQAQTIGAGLYTVNEWRKFENKLPVEGGDKVLVSANLRGLEEDIENNSSNEEDNQ